MRQAPYWTRQSEPQGIQLWIKLSWSLQFTGLWLLNNCLSWMITRGLRVRKGKSRAIQESIADITWFNPDSGSGKQYHYFSFFQTRQLRLRSLSKFLGEREVLGFYLVSFYSVLSAHTQKQNYSPMLELYLFCKFKFGHIIVWWDQRFLPLWEASGGCETPWNCMQISVSICLCFLQRKSLGHTMFFEDQWHQSINNHCIGSCIHDCTWLCSQPTQQAAEQAQCKKRLVGACWFPHFTSCRWWWLRVCSPLNLAPSPHLPSRLVGTVEQVVWVSSGAPGAFSQHTSPKGPVVP